MERFKALWIDDQIEHLTPYVQKLEQAGIDVDCCPDGQSAFEFSNKKKYNIFLVDLKMPKMDGVDVIRKLQELVENKETIYCAFSSFLYLRKYRDRLAALNIQVQLLDKDFPPLDSAEINDRFVMPIVELLKKGPSRPHPKKSNKAKEARSEINPFHISYSSFIKLPMERKEELQDLAAAMAKKCISKAFDEGAIWVLLCGSELSTRAVAHSSVDILSENQILDYAKRFDCAPYQFFSDAQVDDMSISCQGNFYPAVNLQFTSYLDGAVSTSRVHFDTGAPMSFFSYEELVGNGIIRPSALVGSVYRRHGFKKRYMALPLKISAILTCEQTGGSRSVEIHGQNIKDWEESPFNRICKTSCGVDAKGALCPMRRIGLIGSNLLTDNGLALIIDGSTGKTGFVGSNSEPRKGKGK